MTDNNDELEEELEDELESRRLQAVRLVNVGGYLQRLRKAGKHILADVANAVGISPTYLSDIEHGRKLPSDLAIRELAKFYEINELDLFSQFGKIPISVKEELHDNVWLQRTLLKIRKSKKLSDEKKQEFYDQVQLLYKDMLDEEL